MDNQIESFIMTKDEFNDFMKILHFVSGVCDDLNIVDKKVLQRDNMKVAIIKCDLSNFFQFDGEVILYKIAEIFKNLRGLNKDGPIRFKRIGESILVKDTITSISISLGEEKYCDNEKITEADFNKIFILGPMFLECEIDKSLCNSVSNFSKFSNQHNISLNIRSGNVALGYGSVGDQGIRSEFKVNSKLKEDMFDCKMNLPAMIFGLKTATALKIYFDEKNGKTNAVAICIFKFDINQNTALEIYCRANIMRDQKEE